MENGFQGKDGQQVPEMTDEKVKEISDRYIQLYEQVTGDKFQKEDITDEALVKGITAIIDQQS
jgi:phosphoribosylaminoimidazole-succinocarboxamide synthase